MSISLNELAELCQAKILGGNTAEIIHSAADITSAQHGQVTQLTSPKYSRFFKDCKASACFITEDFKLDSHPDHIALLITPDPEIAFLKAVECLHPEKNYPNKISTQADIDASAKISHNVFVGAFAVIGEHAEIGDSSRILPGAYIGNHVKLGRNCRIHPYAVIYDNCVLGDNVIVHSGAIIGADGFGYKFRKNAHIKVPQVGNVVIEDNVEIGANTCIDRGALGSTTIGFGSKIDNLVQIGHNNKIGSHVIMCGLTGISGSCNIGDYAVLAGSSGVADHVDIGKGAVVLARSGVAGDVEAGSHVFGSPAKDKKTAYKEQIAISKLPELIKKIKELEEKLNGFES